MCAWFGVLAVLGVMSIWQAPDVLAALNPIYAFGFLAAIPGTASSRSAPSCWR